MTRSLHSTLFNFHGGKHWIANYRLKRPKSQLSKNSQKMLLKNSFWYIAENSWLLWICIYCVAMRLLRVRNYFNLNMNYVMQLKQFNNGEMYWSHIYIVLAEEYRCILSSIFGLFYVWIRLNFILRVCQNNYTISNMHKYVYLKHGSDVHHPVEIRVKMSDFLGVIDEECHNWRGKFPFKNNLPAPI